MDNDVTDVTEPVQDVPAAAAAVPWFRRRATLVGGIAAAALLALVGGLMWVFGGDKPAPDTALKPIVPSSAAPVPAEPPSSDEAGGLDLIGGLGGSSALDTGGSASDSAAAAGLFATPGGSAPTGGLPAFELPPPSAAAFPPPPPVDWGLALAPLIKAQQDAAAANLSGAIAGPVVGAAWGTANTAVLVISDLILFAAANPNGGALLNQLQAVLPAITVPAAAAGLGSADFSGLSSAFAAAAAMPPLGVPTLPQLPGLPPPPAGLPTPEQVLAGLAALPAVGLPGLPPPPPIGLPTPEQVAGGLFALPAIGLPALPPPPPFGMPVFELPRPPDLTPLLLLPLLGLLPSPTRMIGLPF